MKSIDKPWVWVQPKDRAELLQRLADARDLAVPEKERENLCACAHEALFKAEQEREKLQALVYVPGVWRCAKCELRLVHTNLHVKSGTFSANNEPQPCPNGCGPLWRISERDERKAAVKDFLAESERLAAATDELSRATQELATLRDRARHGETAQSTEPRVATPK